MGVFATNQAEIDNGALIKDTHVKDLYGVLSGSIREDITLSGSLTIETGSVNIQEATIGTITSSNINVTSASGSFTGSFKGDTGLFSNLIATGSFSGSFTGNGSGLSGIVASAAPAGINGAIQFNDTNNSGGTSGSNNLTYNVAADTLHVTGSIIATSVTASAYSGSTAGLTMPVIKVAWSDTESYYNLTNAIDNQIPFDSEQFNTNTDVFEFVGTSTSDARIHIKQTGYYEFISNAHLFDLSENVDITVKIVSGSSTGTMDLVTLLADKKFAELGADQLINGNVILHVDTPAYYSYVINPSANTPYPSNSDNTPSALTIKKIG